MLREILKRTLPSSWVGAIRQAKAVPLRLDILEKQALLMAEAAVRRDYAGQLAAADPDPAFNRHELKVRSQNGEDGLLLHIFSEIGITNRAFVEFGIGDGRECNTANLSLNFGWHGLLMDGGAEKVAKAAAFYARHLKGEADRVRIAQRWITKDTINQTLSELAPEQHLDLLSIDIDGNDYWVWQAMEAVTARVVVIEYNATYGHQRAISTKYDPEFARWQKHPSGMYFGASLAALAKLGAAKGYRLVGCDRHGVNAFFVREDVATAALPALTPKEAYFPLDDRLLGLITPESFEVVKHLEFVEV